MTSSILSTASHADPHDFGGSFAKPALEDAGATLAQATGPSSPGAPSPDSGLPLKLILPLGRGNLGKSFWTHWLIDRARTQGQQILAADCNQIYQSLAPYFSDVVLMRSSYDEAFVDWIETIARSQTAGRATAVADLGPDHDLLRRVLAKASLGKILKRAGIDIVAVYFLGADPGDIPYLKFFDDLTAPTHSILVFSEAPAVPPSTEEAFLRAINHPIVQEIRNRGATLVRFPRLDGAIEIGQTGLTFSAALAGAPDEDHPAVRLFDQERLAAWLDEMERNFAPVMPLLT